MSAYTDPTLQFYAVESSNLEAVAYKQDEKRLFVVFKNGTAYCYDGVPLNIFGGLLAAESAGKFLNSVVKAGPYEFIKVAASPAPSWGSGMDVVA